MLIATSDLRTKSFKVRSHQLSRGKTNEIILTHLSSCITAHIEAIIATESQTRPDAFSRTRSHISRLNKKCIPQGRFWFGSVERKWDTGRSEFSVIPSSFSRIRSLDDTVTSRRIPIEGTVERDKDISGPSGWKSHGIRRLAKVILLNI